MNDPFELFIFAGGVIVGFTFGVIIVLVSTFGQAYDLGTKMYQACDLAVEGSKPELKQVVLPNNNIGYVINCEK